MNNYYPLAEKLKTCTHSECEDEVKPSPEMISNLITLIRHGNPQAIDLGFICRRILSGGSLEDLTRALASTINNNPKKFLIRIKNFSLTPSESRQILRMLPVNLIDNNKERRKEINHRITLLLAVKDTDLLDVRDAAIRNLRE